jgi:excisionase family DNA binding protein
MLGRILESTDLACRFGAVTREQRKQMIDTVIDRYNGSTVSQPPASEDSVWSYEEEEADSEEPVRSGDPATLVTRLLSPSDADALLTPREVAAMFRVSPKTITLWARTGKVSSVRTMGGHRRYRASEIRKLLEALEGESVRI